MDRRTTGFSRPVFTGRSFAVPPADFFTQTWEPVPLGRVCSQKPREAALHAAAAECFDLRASSQAAGQRQILPKVATVWVLCIQHVFSPSHAQGWNLLVFHLIGFLKGLDLCLLSFGCSSFTKKVRLYISTCTKHCLKGNKYSMMCSLALISVKILVMSISY